MKHCYGSVEFLPGVTTQGECGSADLHDEHDFDPATRICMRAHAGFEADCGQPGPHDEHPYSTGGAR